MLFYGSLSLHTGRSAVCDPIDVEDGSVVVHRMSTTFYDLRIDRFYLGEGFCSLAREVPFNV